MNYHDIKHDNMVNGTGLRCVLFVSYCDKKCSGCHNKETWDADSGIPFDREAKEEIWEALSHDYIDGITLSGGDPFAKKNIDETSRLIHDIKTDFPNKTVWVYTGERYEHLLNSYYYALTNVDVLVDGKFVQELLSPDIPWVGSSNQRVISVQESLKQDKIVLYQTT